MSGRKADVIKAAHLCAEAALRLVKPGNQVGIGKFGEIWGIFRNFGNLGGVLGVAVWKNVVFPFFFGVAEVTVGWKI